MSIIYDVMSMYILYSTTVYLQYTKRISQCFYSFKKISLFDVVVTKYTFSYRSLYPTENLSKCYIYIGA